MISSWTRGSPLAGTGAKIIEEVEGSNRGPRDTLPRKTKPTNDELVAIKIRLFAGDIAVVKSQAQALGLRWQIHLRSVIHGALRGPAPQRKTGVVR